MSNGHAQFALPLPPLPLQNRCGNIDPLSIAYAFQPRLRPRLTLRGLTLRRKPQVFGGRVFHTPDATHADILTSLRSTVHSRDDFTAKGTLPYPSPIFIGGAIASVTDLSPVGFSARHH